MPTGTARDQVGIDPNGAPVKHYLAHANLALGPRQWEWHASPPTAAVYKHPATGALIFLAANYSAAPSVVTFYRNGSPSGTLTVPPHSQARAGSLSE